MTPSDYEVFIKKIEKKFEPDIGALQDAVIKAADAHSAFLKASLHSPKNVAQYQTAQYQPESTLQAYQRCKEALRQAVYGAHYPNSSHLNANLTNVNANLTNDAARATCAAPQRWVMGEHSNASGNSAEHNRAK